MPARPRRGRVVDGVFANRALLALFDVSLELAHARDAELGEELVAGQRAGAVLAGAAVLVPEPRFFQQQRVIARLSKLQKQHEDVHVISFPSALDVLIEQRLRALL